jgi:serine/threonine protein kinase
MIIINNKYEIIKDIGTGEFGSVFQARNIRTEENVALKLEKMDSHLHLLKNECLILRHLSNVQGICQLKWFGKHANEFYVMVTTLLHMSIEEMKEFSDTKTLSVEQTLDIASNTIVILKAIHEKHIIHRDIKAENIMVDASNQLFLIDFGLSKCFMNEKKKHNDVKITTNIIGTPTFISCNGHKLIELSRRDDLESLGYAMIYLIKGTLKWSHLDITQDFERTNAVILKAKENVDKIYADIPISIINYIKRVQQMEYDETPDYDALISLLNTI